MPRSVDGGELFKNFVGCIPYPVKHNLLPWNVLPVSMPHTFYRYEHYALYRKNSRWIDTFRRFYNNAPDFLPFVRITAFH